MTTHELKTAEPYYSAVASGAKDFEYRQYTAQGDQPARDFQIGDLAWIRSKEKENESIIRRIKYVLRDTDPHMQGRMAPGYCILGLEAL